MKLINLIFDFLQDKIDLYGDIVLYIIIAALLVVNIFTTLLFPTYSVYVGVSSFVLALFLFTGGFFSYNDKHN